MLMEKHFHLYPTNMMKTNNCKFLDLFCILPESLVLNLKKKFNKGLEDTSTGTRCKLSPNC